MNDALTLIAAGIAIYFLVGIVCAIASDRYQMRREVPYAELPAIASLNATRYAISLILVVIWPVALGGFWRELVHAIRRERVKWIVERALRRAHGDAVVQAIVEEDSGDGTDR